MTRRAAVALLNVRCDSTDQRARWKAAAERERRTLSAWVRWHLDDAALKSERSKPG